MAERPIIAGVDGSPPSLTAARQAAAIAEARGVPLLLIHGFLHPGWYGNAPLEPYTGYLPEAPADGESMLSELSRSLRKAHPDLVVTHKQVLGGGATSLVAESRDAQLLVVGCRGHGGFAGLLLGSVSAQAVAHAHCPVLVVRPPEEAPPVDNAPVLVGVDGSPGSTTALEYAAAEAARRRLRLLVVTAGVPHTEDAVRTSEPLLAEAVHEARSLHPELSVDAEVRHGDGPAAALVEASRKAALVVVGSRGRGGFTGLVLGSVSQTLVHHAHCPVLVIPPPAAASQD